MNYTGCRSWEQQGLIRPDRPVPDANTVSQRSFEALIVNILANALRDRQLDGAALGIVAIVPTASSPRLYLHPGMANRVLWELLPRYDTDGAGVHGVPGMRLDQDAGKIVLRDQMSDAHVYVARPADPKSLLPKRLPSEQPLWLNSSADLHRDETKQRAFWSGDGRAIGWPKPAGRDWLMSRMLRRPALVNKSTGKHEWVNSYTHASEDLVLEWCCGPTPSDLAGQFRRSGLTSWPDDPQLGPPRVPPDDDPGTLWLGERWVTLRLMSKYVAPSSDIAAAFPAPEEWYL